MLETNTIAPLKSLTAYLKFLDKMLEKGGSDQYDYPFFNQILGNVTPAHSLKGYMEILMKWLLHIRTAKDLIRLSREAGLTSDVIKIGVEEAGIFLFLHIEMP